ncbi:unnamed protein product [Acanthoscelides obtectus]|uniref:C2H2-type domain-containing protein n=1 Tax=Acanthoscelides obtectus TaxID=200917 RepID=A0A9P0JZL9_ACAOB|nr:unnamed protein product [Acanthoscelides obtectus]CAK1669701.1 Longitudinals lacking protein, isoforms A/B/D/L [Acanthoscelides obtectus]
MLFPGVWVYVRPHLLESADPLSVMLEEEAEVNEDDLASQTTSELVKYKYDIFECPKCGNVYQRKHSLTRHLKFECQIEPGYHCLVEGCTYKGKYEVSVKRHMANIHPKYNKMLQAKANKRKMISVTTVSNQKDEEGQRSESRDENYEENNKQRTPLEEDGNGRSDKDDARNSERSGQVCLVRTCTMSPFTHLSCECETEPGYSCVVEGCSYKGDTVVDLKKHITRKHPEQGLSEIKKRFLS